MSTRNALITVVAILVLITTMGAVWGIDQQKADQQLAAQKTELVKNTYETPAQPKQYRIIIVKAPEQDAPSTELPSTPHQTSTNTSATQQTSTSSSSTATGQQRTTQAPDFDNDTIPDASDRCPTRPETMNGFQDGDGCPDIVNENNDNSDSTGAS